MRDAMRRRLLSGRENLSGVPPQLPGMRGPPGYRLQDMSTPRAAFNGAVCRDVPRRPARQLGRDVRQMPSRMQVCVWRVRAEMWLWV